MARRRPRSRRAPTTPSTAVPPRPSRAPRRGCSAASPSQNPIVTTVDARGLACPLPLTMARRRMSELAPGDRLRVLATDPEAQIDLAAWAAEEGHGFEQRSGDGFVEFELVKALS